MSKKNKRPKWFKSLVPKERWVHIEHVDGEELFQTKWNELMLKALDSKDGYVKSPGAERNDSK